MTITYSSQFEQFCQDIGAEAYIVGYNSERAILRDGRSQWSSDPSHYRSRGAMFHLREVFYGLGLLATAVRFRANLAVIDSGTTHYFVTTLFRLMGIRVVPVLYNSIWPNGFPPTRSIPRLICWLDSLFYRHVAMAVIGVSPECTRQVEQITPGRYPPLYQVRAQFMPEYFAQIPPPPPYDQRPFQIMFLGRMIRCKGIFDILEMAQKVEAREPGRVRWEICGSGHDLDEFNASHHEMGLESIVKVRGWNHSRT